MPCLPRLAVGAVVLRGDTVLLIRRAKPPSEGAWSLPGGGVEPGESLKHAVQREIIEETGLRVEPGALLCLYEHVQRDRAGDVEFHHVVADFLCAEAGGRLRAGSDVSEAAFLDLAEAAQRDVTEGLLPLLVRVLARHGTRARSRR